MSPILFYGVPSGCSFGSLVAFEWSGAPYRLCRIDMPGVVAGEAYRRINPRGETPALLDGAGRPLSESIAVLHHAAARTAGDAGAGARDARAFDRLNRMLGFLNSTFFNAYSPLWHLFDGTPGDDERRVLGHYGAGMVASAHRQLSRMLGEAPWLLGDRRSVADAYFAGIARWSDHHHLAGMAGFPNLAGLYARLQDDPAVRFAHAVERDGDAAGRGAAGCEGHVTLDEALALLRDDAA